MGIVLIVIIACLLLFAGLYLLLIMPRVLHKADASAFKNVLYAHRGLHDNASAAPENSMAAFQKAVDAGFGIELDIQLTKDQVPVVFHDYSLKRVCGVDKLVCELTYEELMQYHLGNSDEQIPKLEDVLSLVDGKVPLIVEFKGESVDTALCPIADKLLRAYRGLYCIESFNPMIVYWYRRNHPEVMRGQLADAFYSSKEKSGLLYFALEHLLLNCLAKPDFIAYNHKRPAKLSKTLCCKLFKSTAVAWTIQSEEQLPEAKKHFEIFIFDSFVPQK